MYSYLYRIPPPLLTPKNMFLLESKPAAKIFAFAGSQRFTRMRQAKREIVLCITLASFLSPGSVSITTKSIGDSEERPTCKIINSKQSVIRTSPNSKQSPSSIDPVIHPVSIYIHISSARANLSLFKLMPNHAMLELHFNPIRKCKCQYTVLLLPGQER